MQKAIMRLQETHIKSLVPTSHFSSYLTSGGSSGYGSALSSSLSFIPTSHLSSHLTSGGSSGYGSVLSSGLSFGSANVRTTTLPEQSSIIGYYSSATSKSTKRYCK